MAAPALSGRRSGRGRRRVWLVAGLVVLLVAVGTGLVLAQSGSSDGDAVAVSAITQDSAVPSSDRAGSAVAPPVAVSTAVAPVTLSPSPTVIVLDASGSMKNEDAPGPRIDAAKAAVWTLIDGLPDGSPVGLVVYGTSTDGSDAAKTAGCQDIKTLVPVAPVDKGQFAAAMDGVVASGYTPIGSSMRAAVAQLPAAGNRNIVVVSDGDDTCAPPEPCDVAKEIGGSGLVIHTVGFRVTGTAKDQLTCIAQAGGGRYVDAANATQLQAFLRTAVDPNATVDTLTHTGFGDLTIGMSADQANAIDPSIDPARTGTVVIVWRDCDLTFTDGTLMSIEPHHASSTQDGLAVGDDAGKAAQLYGSSAVQTDNGRVYAVFAVEPGSELGYDVTFTPDTIGQLAGPVTRIVLCLCKPSVSSTATTVDSNDFLKTTGRWWFRTPDDGWNCSISSRVFCESRFYSSNHEATYPPPTRADEVAIGCGDIELAGGMAVATVTEAQYGLCGHGEPSEFVYDVDKGTPGLGRILADGQVLIAGGFRCFITGFAVTCGSDQANGIGFTVDQNDYRVYPQDGAMPEPGGTSEPTGSDVIGPDGFGPLRLGMTIEEAKSADPSLTVTSSESFGCTRASSADAELVFFNPNGKLAWIRPRGNARTPEGLTVGQMGDKAFDLYRPGEPRLATINPSVNYFPVTPGSPIDYAVVIESPRNYESAEPYDASRGKITSISLNGGQQCFG